MKKIFLSILIITFLFSLVPIHRINAQASCQEQCAGLMQVSSSGKRDIAGESYKCCMDACANKSTDFGLCIGIDNPLGEKKEIKDILGSILKAISDIILPIVVVMVIYSGFLYVMARGKAEAIEKAHKTLTWTLIGAAVLLGAQLIANVLIDTVSSIGKDSGYSSTTQKNTNTGSSNIGTGFGNNANTNTNNNSGNNNSNVSSAIKNLKFNLKSQGTGSVTGVFTFDVDSTFTPDSKTLELICYDSGDTSTLGPINPLPNLTQINAGAYTTNSYTINGKGDQGCHIFYELAGSLKKSNLLVVNISSSNSNNSNLLIKDPLDKIDTINNSLVYSKITDFTTNTITYDLKITDPDVDSAGIFCVDIKEPDIKINGNLETQTTVPGLSNGFSHSVKTTLQGTLKNTESYVCAVEYSKPTVKEWLTTWAFPLKVGSDNSIQIYK